MARRPSLPQYVDTVIVGGGPASLILSYILHGHIPYYIGQHYDGLLDSKLTQSPNLLSISPETYAHFSSSLRYSTQALPLNTLLDTLIRPNADTEIDPKPCVEWRLEAERAVNHVVLTSGPRPGGQWVDNPVDASWDIGTLSYSEMLSLPGYSYAEHYHSRHGHTLPDFERPSRLDVADYFASYPAAVGLSDTFHTSVTVSNISRTKDGFCIGSHGIHCKHLVLATGIFSVNVAPSPELVPLTKVHNEQDPVLVVGSGFSAADVIISTPPHRKIIHIFKWAPEARPSPLRGCHQQAYPEYAGVYRQMKLAAMASKRTTRSPSPLMRRKSNPFFSTRDWAQVYEGLPNAEVIQADFNSGNGHVSIRLETGNVIQRTVGDLAYVVGRRGTLDYLEPKLRHEVLVSTSHSVDIGRGELISGRTLRPKVERSFEVAPDVFAIGSLAGDSLVRHAFGGCVSVAGSLMGIDKSQNTAANGPFLKLSPSEVVSGHSSPTGTAHEDLHIDRREEIQV